MSDKQAQLTTIHQAIEAYCEGGLAPKFDPQNPIVRLHEPTFGSDEINVGVTQMLSTFVTMGKQVRAFEEQCSKHFDAGYTLMNNSGSSANLLAVAALANPTFDRHLKAGDEVIVPALSWSTTVWPLVQHQLTPVFVDCDLATYNFDYDKLEAAITPKTKAIMLVHVYGNPCDMDIIMGLAKKHNLLVIEDSCESMGAKFDGKSVGSIGDMGTMSLYYSHHITTFEGGLTFTNNFELVELMRVLRAHGWSREADEKQKYTDMYPDIDPRFIFINQGYNLRPTEVQAVMGQKQLPKLDAIVEARRDCQQTYRKAFDKYGDIFRFQDEQAKGYSSWFGFGIIIDKSAPFTPKELAAHLKSQHIESRPIIAGNMPRHPAFKMYKHDVAGSLECCDTIMNQGIALGCHQGMTQDARDYVIGAVEEFVSAKGVKVAA